MSAPACFLGEALALLVIQELQLAACGIYRSSLAELSVLVGEHLGVELVVEEAKVMESLVKRVKLKVKRSTKAHKVKVDASRARKRSALAKKKKGTSGAYASGGTAAAVDAEAARR
jgi:hypothetical protein